MRSEPRKVHTAVMLEPSMKESLRRLATRGERSLSQEIRRGLRAHVDREMSTPFHEQPRR
jgi:predicted transcriptional regulator